MVSTNIDGMIGRLVEVANNVELITTDGDSYKNYIEYGQYNNHTVNITIKKGISTIGELLNKKWNIDEVTNPDVALKNDFKNIMLSGKDFNNINLKQYAKLKLTKDYSDIVKAIPDDEASLSDIIEFLNNIYDRNDTLDIIKAMGSHGKEITATVYGQEVQLINVNLDNGNKAEIYNNTDKTITAEEIRNDLFSGKLLQQIALNDLKGTYEVKTGDIIYNIVIK
jgi:hypothetical protein